METSFAPITKIFLKLKKNHPINPNMSGQTTRTQILKPINWIGANIGWYSKNTWGIQYWYFQNVLVFVFLSDLSIKTFFFLFTIIIRLSFASIVVLLFDYILYFCLPTLFLFLKLFCLKLSIVTILGSVHKYNKGVFFSALSAVVSNALTECFR